MIRDCNEDTLRMLQKNARMDNARILEVGCGGGRVTRMYADRADTVVGVEPEYAAVYAACDTLPGVSFLCASGAALPFGPNSFDTVLFTLSLHHHPDCLAALAQAHRVVSRSGRVLVLEPTPESEIQRLCKVFEDEDHRLEAVEDSLPGPCFTVEAKERFVTHWEFDDFDDVTEYAFGHYNHPPDGHKREALRKFLGSRAADAPIRMTDTLRLTTLVPRDE